MAKKGGNKKKNAARKAQQKKEVIPAVNNNEQVLNNEIVEQPTAQGDTLEEPVQPEIKADPVAVETEIGEVVVEKSVLPETIELTQVEPVPEEKKQQSPVLAAVETEVPSPVNAQETIKEPLLQKKESQEEVAIVVVKDEDTNTEKIDQQIDETPKEIQINEIKATEIEKEIQAETTEATPQTELVETSNLKNETVKEVPESGSTKQDEVKIEESKVEEPKVEESKVEESKVEEPKVEEPKVEEPKVEEPKVEEPKFEEPKVEEPKVEEVKLQEVASPASDDQKLDRAAAEKSQVESTTETINSQGSSTEAYTEATTITEEQTTDKSSGLKKPNLKKQKSLAKRKSQIIGLFKREKTAKEPKVLPAIEEVKSSEKTLKKRKSWMFWKSSTPATAIQQK
ncbi:hypothetical protein BD560DRAFT_446875 [Blakeslea trispora]|nr:hypothetical protein BD560DRAFT_446875 [Blakeslea trispora]